MTSKFDTNTIRSWEKISLLDDTLSSTGAYFSTTKGWNAKSTLVEFEIGT